LIKNFNETLTKLFKYIPIFDEKSRTNFAKCLGFILSDAQQAIINPTVLQGLLADHLVKDGVFLTAPSFSWISLDDFRSACKLETWF
jgi:hypothetical protein